MLDSINTKHGLPHDILRDDLYEECVKLYKCKFDKIIQEFPFRIAFENEDAVDTGGVARDMFSAFWELSYVQDMDGGSTYVPMVHPHTDIHHYNVLGSILSHGFMACGFLPIRLSFPVIAYTLLGCKVTIPDSIIIESFIDFVSVYENTVFRDALKLSKKGSSTFPPQMLESLTIILGRMGCREIPTPSKIERLIVDVARYELVLKPLSALYSLHAGVPSEYHPFLAEFSVQKLFDLYMALNVTPEAVLDILSTSDDIDANQTRFFSYLKTFIGNVTSQDLRNLLRFTTGSSVMMKKKISVSFNSLDGLARRPTSQTCGCNLALPITYQSYPEFAEEFLNVLRSEVAWPMTAR